MVTGDPISLWMETGELRWLRGSVGELLKAAMLPLQGTTTTTDEELEGRDPPESESGRGGAVEQLASPTATGDMTRFSLLPLFLLLIPD